MDSRAFLLFNTALVILLVWLIFKGRRLRTPTKLVLNKKKSLESETFSEGSMKKGDQNYKGDSETKELTVYFNFNGETMEAHEILGIAAGAPIEMAEAAFQTLSDRPDVHSLDIYKQALEAIKAKRG